ncbi:uncharacterized protein [Miscanthus floridulus]|uniref:uncharacterized protein n=1 Tax=Miscanthus floridulus TaxID=154761 RepID=UPI003458D9F1
MKRGKGIPGRRRDVGGHGRGEGHGWGGVKGLGRGTSSSSLIGLLSSPVPLLLFLPFSHLLLGTGASTADSVDGVGGWRGVLLLLRWPADGAEVLLLLGAGRSAGVGGRRGRGGAPPRVEASGGVELLRWPAPPPSSSGGRGPGAHGVAVAAGRGATRWWAASGGRGPDARGVAVAAGRGAARWWPAGVGGAGRAGAGRPGELLRGARGAKQRRGTGQRRRQAFCGRGTWALADLRL